MKNLILAFVFSWLASSSSFADPMIVWPSDMSHEHIQISEVLGSWWAYTDTEFKGLTLEKADSDKHLYFVMMGRNQQVIASGFLEINMDYFKGEVQTLYSQETVEALLYRSANGFRIQFTENNQTRTYDLFR